MFDEIGAERAALMALLARLTPSEIERPATVGAWSVKDVVAHLAGWFDWMGRAYAIRVQGEPLPADMTAAPDRIDEWNRSFVADRHDRPAEKVIEECEDTLRRLLVFAANLGTTRLYAPNPWPGSEPSIADGLRRFVAAHLREHRLAIEQALEAAH